MAVVLTTTDLGSQVSAVASRTISYAHTGGKDMLVLVASRGLTGTLPVSGITYNSAAMTPIVSIEAGVSDPHSAVDAYRIDDPGTGTHNIVVTWTGTIVANWVHAIDVAGCPTTSPIDSFGSNFTNSGVGVDVTHTRIAADTMSVFLITRPAAVVTWTANNGLVEISQANVVGGVNYQLASLQESSSGSLVRGSANTTTSKVSALCVSYKTASAALEQPYAKRLGGVPFADTTKGVW